MKSKNISANQNHGYSNETVESGRFSVLIKKNRNQQFHFLLLLTSIMEQVFQQLKQTIEEKSPKISGWLSEEFLVELVLNKFMVVVNPMIIRACVLEMHVAGRNRLLEGDTPEARFDFFLASLLKPENAKDFFDKYPVIKEQLVIFSSQFCNVMGELFQRLNKDKEALTRHFFKGNKNYQLISIYSSGDVHQQGRSVCILTFENRKKKIKLVYKPRSPNLDIAFQKFITWFNQCSPRLPLRTINILGCKEYGWCEFVDYLTCKNEKEIKQFYIRLGKWLMLIYLFRGGDIHGENLIAHGAHPLVVDFECLLTPLYSFSNKPTVSKPRFLTFQTLFLPALHVINKEHTGFDLSVLGSEPGAEGGIPMIKWVDVGKDTMHAERSFGKMPGFLNKPTLKNKAVEYLHYEKEFLQGFHDAYQMILQHKSDLLGKRSPLKSFKRVTVRLVMRSTSTYFHFLYESWHPKLLFDRKSRTNYFKTLWGNGKKSRLYQALVRAEQRDLEQNNIPFFSALSDGTEMLDSTGKVIGTPILMTGLTAVRDHIKNNLNRKDLFLQETFIKNSFSIARQNRNMNIVRPCTLNLRQKPFSGDELKRRALALAKRELDQLAEHCFFMDDDIFWPSSSVSESDIWVMELTSIDFYNGLPGIALSYLYASQIFPDDAYAEMAERCINTLKKWLKKSKLESINLMGAYAGGGLLYTLAAFYRFSRDKTIKHILQKCLRALPMQIKKDEVFDIIAGSAGSIVLLLSLGDIFPKQVLMPGVHACAKRILGQYPVPDEFPRSDSKIDAIKPLLGMAHGVSGIAWALHQYYLITHNKKVRNWIEAGLAYERSQFNSEKANWPDYRVFAINKSATEEHRFGAAWCHGAAGAGVARLDMAKHWKDAHIEQEIKIALKTTLKQGFGKYGCLCHGNFGNLDFLLAAAQQLSDPALTNYYQVYASALIRASDQHSIQCSQLINTATPGIMTGRAGIAYELMRTAKPDILPSLLLLRPTVPN